MLFSFSSSKILFLIGGENKIQIFKPPCYFVYNQTSVEVAVLERRDLFFRGRCNIFILKIC